MTGTRPVRVAIVGSGPSGLFAAEALTAQTDYPVEIVIFERLPVPFGLLRYGVAPDHLAMRGLRRTFEPILEHPAVTFAGGVEIGRDLGVDDLADYFDIRIYAYGASGGRHLNVPGEDADICLSASEFAAWYCGHPDARHDEIGRIVARARSAVVIGAGNVALDSVRVLAKSEDALAKTDMPDHVRAALAAAGPRCVSLVARRGPEDAKFTTKELRELGTLDGAEVNTRAMDFDHLDDATMADLPRTAARNLHVLSQWRQARTALRVDRSMSRIYFRFFERPVKISADNVQNSVVLERQCRRARDLVIVPADLVITAIGYRGNPLLGLPFDTENATIPTAAGRVQDNGKTRSGDYAVGWIRRGPTGVIGSNKVDAHEVVESILADIPLLTQLQKPIANRRDLFQGKALQPLDINHWHRIDAEERELGAHRGAERTTLHRPQDLYA